jgi:hypothetical protein
VRLFGKVNGVIDRFDRAAWMTPPFDLAFLAFLDPAIPTDIRGTIAEAPGYADETSLIAGVAGQPDGNALIRPAPGYPDSTSTIKEA